MTSKPGPRELALRAQREAGAGRTSVKAPKPPKKKKVVPTERIERP